LEFTIDRVAVQTEIVNAIVNTTLGQKIEEAVNQALKPTFGGKSVIDQAIALEVQEQVRIECRKLIREPGPIHDAIASTLAHALGDDALKKIIDAFVTDLGLVRTEDLRRA
jgi:hypothetical protein